MNTKRIALIVAGILVPAAAFAAVSAGADMSWCSNLFGCCGG